MIIQSGLLFSRQFDSKILFITQRFLQIRSSSVADGVSANKVWPVFDTETSVRTSCHIAGFTCQPAASKVNKEVCK